MPISAYNNTGPPCKDRPRGLILGPFFWKLGLAGAVTGQSETVFSALQQILHHLTKTQDTNQLPCSPGSVSQAASHCQAPAFAPQS